MKKPRYIEYIFLSLCILGVGYVAWQVLAPFIAALTLAGMITILSYPLFKYLNRITPWKVRGINAFITLSISYALLLGPLFLFGYMLLAEAQAIYVNISVGSKAEVFISGVHMVEQFMDNLLPGVNIDMSGQIQKFAGMVASNLGGVFAGMASLITTLGISMLSTFYLLRDGKDVIEYMKRISPFSEDDDARLLRRISGAVRGVVFGVLSIAVVQSLLTTIGLSLLGFERAILFGVIAAFGALIPGVGAGLIVFTPLTLYLLFTGEYALMAGVAIWGFAAVTSIDNVIGPYIMRWGGTRLHPLLILFSVLGGIFAFGPIGFILGPVVVSVFTTFIEIYAVKLAPKYNSHSTDGA